MSKKTIVVLLIVVTLVVISFIRTNYFFTKEESEQKTSKIRKREITVNLNKNGAIETLNLEAYLVGVIACEMPASFEIEALKAQAVAARTYALKKQQQKNSVEGTINDQCHYDDSEMQKQWGNEKEKYKEKITDAVNKTKGEVMYYNNKLITAYYFAMSNGKTENSEYVFNNKKDYLKTVNSKWEEKNKNFKITTEYTEQQIKQYLNIEDDLTINLQDYTPTNRVKTLIINNEEIKAIDFRKKLNLRSTDFTIKKENNKYYITTRGYGHGVGMSQYGANGMAKENNTYKEILKYYYKNIKILNV